MQWSTGAGATDRGPRPDNQDAFLSAGPVHVVADGIGGQRGGGAASKAIVEAFQHLTTVHPAQPREVGAAVRIAQQAVDRVAAEYGGESGSTLTGAVAVEHKGEPWWMVINVGDSRVYVVDDDDISQVTVDHSYVQELVDRGEITRAQAYAHPDRNIITRAIGDGDPNFDAWLVPVVPGQQLVITSDGLPNTLPDARIASIVRRAEDSAAAAQGLIDAALAAGANDNVTVIVTGRAEVATSADADASPWQRWPEEVVEDDDTTLDSDRDNSR